MGFENQFAGIEKYPEQKGEQQGRERQSGDDYDPEAERNRLKAEVVDKMVDHQAELDKMSNDQRAVEAATAEASQAYGKELSEKAQAEFDERQDLDKAA